MRYAIRMVTTTGVWWWAGISKADPLAGYSQWKPSPEYAQQYRTYLAALNNATQLQAQIERLFGEKQVEVVEVQL